MAVSNDAESRNLGVLRLAHGTEYLVADLFQSVLLSNKIALDTLSTLTRNTHTISDLLKHDSRHSDVATPVVSELPRGAR